MHIGINTDDWQNLSATMLWRGDRMEANKALVPDKRRMEIRYDCGSKIKWSYFNTGGLFDAKILNCSTNGNYLETSCRYAD